MTTGRWTSSIDTLLVDEGASTGQYHANSLQDTPWTLEWNTRDGLNIIARHPRYGAVLLSAAAFGGLIKLTPLKVIPLERRVDLMDRWSFNNAMRSGRLFTAAILSGLAHVPSDLRDTLMRLLEDDFDLAESRRAFWNVFKAALVEMRRRR